MDQSHYNAIFEGIWSDIAEAEQQIEELRELEQHVEKYLNRKFRDSDSEVRGGDSKPREKANSIPTETISEGTVRFGPNGFPAG